MKTVKDILHAKGTTLHTIELNQTVYTALEMMAKADVGALMVLDNEGKLVGLLSERDYARKVILRGLSSLKTPVNDIMTEQVCYVTPQQTTDECMGLMTENRCRHLPVMCDGELQGIVSIGDLVKATISEKELLIDQLTNYIQSS